MNVLEKETGRDRAKNEREINNERRERKKSEKINERRTTANFSPPQICEQDKRVKAGENDQNILGTFP